MALERLLPEQAVYVPETRLNASGVKKVGVGIFIVEMQTGRVWTVEEKQSKVSTSRRPGSVSIPLETRKVGETVMENVVGALQEFRPLAPGEWLEYRDAESYKGRFPLMPGVLGDLVVVGLHGYDPRADTFEIAEVRGGGWRCVEELVQDPLLRVGVEGFLGLAIQGAWTEKFQVGGNNETRSRTLQADDVLYQYVHMRDQFPDWEGKGQI